MAAPAGDDDGGRRSGGVKAEADAGGDRHGGEDVNRADGGAGQRCQNARQDAEDEDQDEGVDVGAQHVGDRLADEGGQAGVAQRVSNADDTGGHQDDGGADGVADLGEVQHTEDEQAADSDTGQGVARVTDGALQDHADNGDDEADVSNDLFVAGQGGNGGLVGLGFLGSFGDGVIGHNLVAQQAPDEEAQRQRHIDEGELDEVDVCDNAGTFENCHDDAVLQSSVEGQQRVVCGEARRHQHLGRGQLLGVGQRAQQADRQHVVGSGTGAEQAAAEHDDEDQRHIGLEATVACHLVHHLAELDDEAGLLQRRHDGHEGRQHNDSGIGEAAERGLDVGDTKDDKEQQRQQRGRTEGEFVDHDQDDHEHCNRKCDYHRHCHCVFLLKEKLFFLTKYRLYLCRFIQFTSFNLPIL